MVIPVPLHPRKLRRRGFNQALELARGALEASPPQPVGASDSSGSTPSLRPPRLERNLLRRVRETRELGRSGPNERRAEVAGAFAIAQPGRVLGKRILLVDDVMTTGATLNACATTLLEAGATEVRVLALARAVA